MIKLLISLVLLTSSAGLYAMQVKLENADGKAILAEFKQGDNKSNPVLILHGFLQTHEFSTVARLAETLHESGYSVLTPTLSLGISNRKESLSCEAIHTHSIKTEAEELALWVKWLHQKSSAPVTLIGHSAGGPVILKYMIDTNALNVDHSILISLSYYASGPEANETVEDFNKATLAVNNGDKKLDTYSLNYCQTYTTYADAFLSYYNWDKSFVSEVIGKYGDKTSIILGTGDKRIDSDWSIELQSQHKNVIPVDGANHFFDQAYEFELSDVVEQLLEEKR